MSSEQIVKMLKDRACAAGESWTGDHPEQDHGHTDCYLHYQSIQEIERLQVENKKLANYLLSEFVFIHERLIEEVDVALLPYLGGSFDED
jgi:hypothetical protein